MPFVLLASAALATGCAGSSTSHASSTVTTGHPHARDLDTGGRASTTSIPRRFPVVAAAPWSLPEPRAREGLVAAGGKLEVLGGLDHARSSTASVASIDVRSGAATRGPGLAVPVHDVAAAVVGGAPMVIGGGNTTERAEVQRADGVVTGRLPEPRSDAAAVTVSGRTFVVGGYDGAHWRNDVLETVDGVHFRVVATLPVPVRYAAVAARADGTIVIAGGDAPGGETDAVQELDVAHGTARVVAHLPQPIAHASAATLDDRVFVFGGRVAGTPSAAVRELDARSGAITIVGSLPQPTTDGAAATVGDTVYFAGGESPAPTARVTTLVLR